MSTPISVALQGGGTHAAFSWGVLDRILEDDTIRIEAISGTSAGAINGAVLLSGQIKGGNAGARKALDAFWRAISLTGGKFNPIQSGWWHMFTGEWTMDNSPAYVMFDMMSRMFSPYDFNPMNFNPLKEILSEHIDVSGIRQQDNVRIFITATDIETGEARIFNNNDISVDALLASSCLPYLMQAIEIDGKFYWNGGYVGNPTLTSLISPAQPQDIVLIRINPIVRKGVPKTPTEIINRISEINFHNALKRELQLWKDSPNVYLPKLHTIESEEMMSHLSASSKLNTDWDFLNFLKELGKEQADAWVKRFKDQQESAKKATAPNPTKRKTN